MNKLREASRYIREQIPSLPEVGIILGSGLGNFTRELHLQASIDYRDIPFFPEATVLGHSGKLISAECRGKQILVMEGRFHYYEGHSMQEVIFPVRTMALLGIRTMCISNAAGGLNPAFRVGDLMVITDHINLQPEHPLRGPNLEQFGLRFPDMSEPYNAVLVEKALEIAALQGIALHRGVYAGVQGPTFETQAEYRYLHLIGADAVGMSTVAEVLACVHAGIRVFALSVITDLGIPGMLTAITHEEVLAAAEEAEPKLTVIFKELIASL